MQCDLDSRLLGLLGPRGGCCSRLLLPLSCLGLQSLLLLLHITCQVALLLCDALTQVEPAKTNQLSSLLASYGSFHASKEANTMYKPQPTDADGRFSSSSTGNKQKNGDCCRRCTCLSDTGVTLKAAARHRPAACTPDSAQQMHPILR